VNTATRAFPVEATVPNGERTLKPGSFARARLVSDLLEPVVTIPAAAIQNRYGVNRVFVVTRGLLSAREVKLGDRRGERVEIQAGLEAGDEVALSNVDTLADGMPVRPVPVKRRLE
jgi:multidrug efflux pump subunit AcrA (membrane-fusion protein)